MTASPPRRAPRDRLTGWLFAILLLVSPVLADTNTPAASVGATNAAPGVPEELLRSQLQLQEQLHNLQTRWERSQEDAESAAARNSELIAEKLRTIESSLNDQRAKELETIQSSNRTLLLVAGGFAAVGFVTMLVMAFLQWRALNRWSATVPGIHPGHLLGQASAVPGMGGIDARLLNPSPQVEQSNLRLAEALSRLEENLLRLNTAASARPNVPAREASAAAPNYPGDTGTNGAPPEVAGLLGKGQSLLSMDKPEEALACFEQVLQSEPKNGEALMKKGLALERLGKHDEALRCYDDALEANPALTVAYLHKGGLYNRMERFAEALECYEQALRRG